MWLNGRRLVGSGVPLTCESASRDLVTPLRTCSYVYGPSGPFLSYNNNSNNNNNNNNQQNHRQLQTVILTVQLLKCPWSNRCKCYDANAARQTATGSCPQICSLPPKNTLAPSPSKIVVGYVSQRLCWNACRQGAIKSK